MKYYFLIIMVIINYHTMLFSQENWNTSLINTYKNGSCFAVQIVGNLAFIGNGSYLEILDISDPEQIISIGKGLAPSYIMDVDVNNNYVYVASTSSGLRIFDINNLNNPIEVGFYDTDGTAVGVFVEGNYAYVADGGNGFVIIDISNPSDPKKVGQWNSRGSFITKNVTIQENYAFVSSEWEHGLLIFDISNPTNPQPVANYGGGLADVSFAELTGEYGYLTQNRSGVACGLKIFSVTNIINWNQLSFYNSGNVYFNCVAIDSQYAYVAADNNGLIIFDLSDPSDPTIIGTFEADGIDATQIIVNENHAYVAGGGSGLWVFDVTDPANPTLSDFHPTGGFVSDVAIDSDYMFQLGRSGLRILELSDSFDTNLVSTYFTNSFLRTFQLFGEYAFLGGGSSAKFLNISDPLFPSEIASVDVGYILGSDISADENYLYYFLYSLGIIDISNPLDPFDIGISQSIDHSVRDIGVFGDYIFLGSVRESKIVDISDPFNLFVIDSINTPENVYDIAVDGNYIYLACSIYGLRIIDVNNPYSVSEIGYYDIRCKNVTISGNYAFLLADNDLHILDISNPHHPTIAGYYNINVTPQNVYVDDHVAYISLGENGVDIIQFTPGLEIDDKNYTVNDYFLSSNYPNPFNPITTIRYQISQKAYVKVSVLDLLGQEVSVLADGVQLPGLKEEHFNARELSSGIYFYQIEAGEKVIVRKMILLK